MKYVTVQTNSAVTDVPNSNHDFIL